MTYLGQHIALNAGQEHTVIFQGLWAPQVKLCGTTALHGRVYAGTVSSLSDNTTVACIIKVHVQPCEVAMHQQAHAVAPQFVLKPRVLTLTDGTLLLATPRCTTCIGQSATLAALMASQAWCDDIAFWVIQQALDAVQALSLTHGDLHTHNVLVQMKAQDQKKPPKPCQLLVIDFGHATTGQSDAGAGDLFKLLCHMKSVHNSRARRFNAWLTSLPQLVTPGFATPATLRDYGSAYTPAALRRSLETLKRKRQQ